MKYCKYMHENWGFLKYTNVLIYFNSSFFLLFTLQIIYVFKPFLYNPDVYSKYNFGKATQTHKCFSLMKSLTISDHR